MRVQTIEEINALLGPAVGWRVELAFSPQNQAECLQLFRKAGKTWDDKIFIWTFPRDAGAGVIAACVGIARRYFDIDVSSIRPDDKAQAR